MIDMARVGPKALWGSGLLASLPAVLLFSAWNRIFAGSLVAAVLATLVSGLWIAAIFISAAVLWQGRESRVFGATSFILCLSPALGGFWLLVFYPAVMSVDALAHWQNALADQYSNWNAPLLPMLMHFTQHFVKSPNLLSFLQGSLFWGALFYLIRQVTRGDRAFLAHSLLLALLPPLWLYSNATTSMAWGTIFLMLAMGLLIGSVKDGRTITLFLSVLSLSVAVMFRREALLCVLVPIVIHLFYFPKKRGWAKKALVAAAIVILSLLPGRLIELSPKVARAARSQIHGVFTQYVGTIVHSMGRMSPAEIDRERKSIDGEFRKGVFQNLIERYDCSTGDYIIYKRAFPPVMKRIPIEKNGFILKKVFSTALRHPGGYLKHQLCYLGHLSQFTGISYQTWGVLKAEPRYESARARLRISYDSKLPSIKAGYVRLMKFLLGHPVPALIFRHYIFLLFSVFFLGFGLVKRRVEWIVPSLVGLVYLFAYLLAGPAGLWRYLLPSYLGAWVCLPTVVASLVTRGGKKGNRPL